MEAVEGNAELFKLAKCFCDLESGRVVNQIEFPQFSEVLEQAFDQLKRMLQNPAEILNVVTHYSDAVPCLPHFQIVEGWDPAMEFVDFIHRYYGSNNSIKLAPFVIVRFSDLARQAKINEYRSIAMIPLLNIL